MSVSVCACVCVQRVYLHWRVVIQWNSLSVEDNTYAALPGVENSREGINGCHLRNAKDLLKNRALRYPIAWNVNERNIIENALNSRADIGHRNGGAVRYQSSVKLSSFQSQLGVSSVSIHSDVLWYNCGCQYIHIVKTQQYYNYKIRNRNYKFSRRSLSEWNNSNLIESISNLALIYINVFSDCSYS